MRGSGPQPRICLRADAGKPGERAETGWEKRGWKKKREGRRRSGVKSSSKKVVTEKKHNRRDEKKNGKKVVQGGGYITAKSRTVAKP